MAPVHVVCRPAMWRRRNTSFCHRHCCFAVPSSAHVAATLGRPSFVAPSLKKGHRTGAESKAAHKRMSGPLELPTTTVEGCTPQNYHCIPSLSVQRWRRRTTTTTSSPYVALPKVHQFMLRHRLLSIRCHRRLFWLVASCSDDRAVSMAAWNELWKGEDDVPFTQPMRLKPRSVGRT